MLTFHVKVEKVTEATGLRNITDSSLLDIHNLIACWLQVNYVLRHGSNKMPTSSLPCSSHPCPLSNRDLDHFYQMTEQAY